MLSPQKNLPNNARVCAIIDEDGHCWDEERVLAEFSPHEAQGILGIPISSRQVPDTLIWASTKSGKYMTKSAYKLLSRTPTVGPSNPSAHSSSWDQIWELEVLNKIKHFIWRACRESLPTKKNLFTKKVTRNAICDLCHDGVEDVLHVLWGCQVLKEVWWEEPCLRNQLAVQFVDFRDLWIGIISNNDHFLAERFAYVTWSIWHNRNATRLKTTCIPYNKIYDDMLDRFKEYRSAQDSIKLVSQDSMVQPSNSDPIHWKPPRSPYCKINFDGATFQDQKMAGIGVVIRNSGGQVIGALSDRINLPAIVDDIEALKQFPLL